MGKTWKMSFDYATHKNVRQFMPFMREMIKQVHNDAHTVKLSHYDATSLMSMAGDGGARGSQSLREVFGHLL